MNFNQLIQTSLRLLLILSLSTLTACDAQENPKPGNTDMGAIVGINYTGEGIQHFTVDEAGGGGVGRYGTSGVICCARYPSKWTPELRVTVEWERSDCEGRWNLCTVEAAKQDKWPHKSFSKTIPIEKYTEDGRIYVAFLPLDEVRVYISRVGPRNINFPSKLGMPHDPDENAGTNRPIENSKPYDPILNRGNR